MSNYYINANLLRQRGACDYVVQQFREAFQPDNEFSPVLLNAENVRKALDHPGLRWNIAWTANRLWGKVPYKSKAEVRAGRIANQLDNIADKAESGKLTQRDVNRAVRLLEETSAMWAERRARLGRRAYLFGE